MPYVGVVSVVRCVLRVVCVRVAFVRCSLCAVRCGTVIVCRLLPLSLFVVCCLLLVFDGVVCCVLFVVAAFVDVRCFSLSLFDVCCSLLCVVVCCCLVFVVCGKCSCLLCVVVGCGCVLCVVWRRLLTAFAVCSLLLLWLLCVLSLLLLPFG